MTVETGKSMFNPEIWPHPISKPSLNFLGLAFASISLDQIPFDSDRLNTGDVIENEFGEMLMFKSDHYKIVTNEVGTFLHNWFCKWTKK